MSTIVNLNIGGTTFTTFKSTLTRMPGYFKTLLETGDGLVKDKSGCIFIDRSPKHFDVILKYMREQYLASTDYEEVMDEAEFYKLKKLVALCKYHLDHPIEHEPSVENLVEDYRFIKDDEQLYNLLADREKDILIIKYESTDFMFREKFAPRYINSRLSREFKVYFMKSELKQDDWCAAIKHRRCVSFDKFQTDIPKNWPTDEYFEKLKEFVDDFEEKLKNSC